MNTGEIILIALALAVGVACSRRWLRRTRRTRLIKRFERTRGSRAIVVVDRSQPVLPWGVSDIFDVDQSETMLRAIQLTDEKVPIDVVLHTPGGIVMAAEQVATALSAHPAKVTVFVPYYAMSGGTIIAIAADEIVMSPVAALGSIDPQFDDRTAASILAAAQAKAPAELDDATLMLADEARKAQRETQSFAEQILRRSVDAARCSEIAAALTDGRWTHEFPISATVARQLGLRVSTVMPPEIQAIVDSHGRTSLREVVSYVPRRYRARS